MYTRQQSTVLAQAMASAVVALAGASLALPAAAQVTRTTAFEYDAFGQLTKQITEPEGDINTVRSAEVILRDSGTGMPTKRQWIYRDPQAASDVVRDVETYSYDARFRYVVQTLNAKSHKETKAYDEGSGALIALTGPNNLTTSFVFDSWGRKVREDRPDGTSLTFAYRNCVDACANGASRVLITQSWFGSSQRAVPREEFFDSLDRRVQTRTWGFNGEQILTDRIFDAKGRLDRVSRPRFAGANQVFTRFTYDDLGRVVEIRTPTSAGDTDVSTQTFSGPTLTRINAKGQRRVEVRSGLGTLRSVRDNDGFTTTFVHDGFNGLSRVVDAKGNEIQIERDVLGRRTKLTDPDLGTRTYVVNPIGQVYRQTDAKGQVTTMEFDVLGRMTRRLAPDQDARWDYDTATTGVGKIAEASTWTGVGKDYRQVYEYDVAGRQLRTTTMMDWAYVAETSYDGLGRASGTQYRRGAIGSSSTVSNGYSIQFNAYGYAAGINWTSDQGSGTLLTRKAMSADGVVTEEQLGNGMVRRRATNAYTGRLEGLTVGVGGADANRQNDSYEYDALGNLTVRTQSMWSDGPRFTEVFSYDGLNRLTSSQVAGEAFKSYSYDAIGNLVSKTGTGDYVYPASGSNSVRPHAVSSIQAATPIAGISNPGFSYDSNGNLLEGLGRRYAWTSFDQPVTIDALSGSTAVQRTAFAFGPDRLRVRQTISPMSAGVPGAPTRTIYYAGAMEKEIDVAGNSTTIRTYMPEGLGYLEERLTGVSSSPSDQSGRAQRYFLTDHLGSVLSVAEEAGALFNRLSYDPWGRRRGQHGEDDPAGASSFGSINNTQDHTGFTGQEQLDQLALVHLNGRVYDPIIGRMISADPTVPDTDDGQHYNRYTYVLNNGLAYVDPSGFSSADPQPRYSSDGGYANGISYGDAEKLQSKEKQEAAVLLGTVTVDGTSMRLPSGAGFNYLSMSLSLPQPTVKLPVTQIFGTRITGLITPAVRILFGTALGRGAILMLIPSNLNQDDPCQTGSLCRWSDRVKMTSVWDTYKSESANGNGLGGEGDKSGATNGSVDPAKSGREKDVPNRGEPGEVKEGERRTREYGPDGKPTRDYDKPHQGYERPHVHEWPGGVREHPGRDYSPWPRQ